MTTEATTPVSAPETVAPTPPADMAAATVALETTTATQAPPEAPAEAPPPTAEAATSAAPAEATPSKLERAKAAADQARRARIARQREAEQAAQLRAERDRYAQQVEWERQQRAQLAQQVQQAEQDPLAYLRSRGIDPKQIVQQAIQDESPEGQIKTVHKALEQERLKREQLEAAMAARDAAAQQESNRRQFLTEASDEETFPTVAKLAKNRPETLLREADWVMEEVRKRTGRFPSFYQTIEWLEHELGGALGVPKSEPKSSGAKTTDATTPAKASQPAATTKTLTSKTSERATLPKSLEEMTKEEQISYFARQLREQAGRG